MSSRSQPDPCSHDHEVLFSKSCSRLFRSAAVNFEYVIDVREVVSSSVQLLHDSLQFLVEQPPLL